AEHAVQHIIKGLVPTLPVGTFDIQQLTGDQAIVVFALTGVEECSAGVDQGLIGGAELLHLERHLPTRCHVKEGHLVKGGRQCVVKRGRGVWCRRCGCAVDPATLALVLDLSGAVSDRTLAAPALVGPIDAMWVEEEYGIAQSALAGTPAFARGGIERLAGGGEKRPVDCIEDQRLARAIFTDDGQHIAKDVKRGVLMSMPVDETHAPDPGAARCAGVAAVAAVRPFATVGGASAAAHWAPPFSGFSSS